MPFGTSDQTSRRPANQEIVAETKLPLRSKPVRKQEQNSLEISPSSLLFCYL